MRLQAATILLIVATSICRAANVNIATNLTQTHAVSKLLYGIFFEEINHAGEGGLYAELVRDRSFDAFSLSNQFTDTSPNMTEAEFKYMTEQANASAVPNAAVEYNTNTGHASKASKMKFKQPYNEDSAWTPLKSTKVFLTKEDPLSAQNLVALNVTTTEKWGGISNGGFWGIPVVDGEVLHFSVFMKGSRHTKVHVKLQSKGGAKVYAEAVSEHFEDYWQQFTANLTASATDYNAEISLQLAEPGSVVMDSWSLFPGKNFIYGRDPYPFRRELLNTLKSLKPRFVRFPGGCYVEGGDWLRNRFPWKTNLGPNYNRSGHLNLQWGYWSSDGLGLFEYMLLAEELGAEPIYVINNGISHAEATPPERLEPFVIETMDALEFITGDDKTTWGSVRASMGRKEPWTLKFLAIGNEDCWRPHYKEDYNVFAKAVKDKYPNIILIANCDLGPGYNTELYDWHTYDDSTTMFNRVHQFDNVKRGGVDAPIFVSEYAVTFDGGWGNLRGAVSEAAFMTGMERNSDIVLLAAYAPLFTRTENRAWSPDMIVFDNHRQYMTPNFWVQQLFSKFQGLLYAATTVDTQNSQVAASTTCLDSRCQSIAIKVVNFDLTGHTVRLSLHGLTDNKVGPGTGAVLYQITGDHPEDENSFDNPDKIKLKSNVIDMQWGRIADRSSVKLDVPAMSVNLLALRTDVYQSTVRRTLDTQS